MEFTLQDGEYLVRLARKAIETRLREGVRIEPSAPKRLMEPRGVFVTLNRMERTHRLRGCIGYPYPEKPLAEAVVDAAIGAAFHDPRFQPISLEEMDEIVVEVSVLTLPERIRVERPEDYPSHIMVGRDGLIVSRGGFRGLLLPQVPIEWGWDAEEFLTQCCLKAWLPPDAWLLPDTEVYRFQAEIFAEEEPRGRIVRVGLERR
jgi:hypothetical protein